MVRVIVETIVGLLTLPCAVALGRSRRRWISVIRAVALVRLNLSRGVRLVTSLILTWARLLFWFPFMLRNNVLISSRLGCAIPWARVEVVIVALMRRWLMAKWRMGPCRGVECMTL